MIARSWINPRALCLAFYTVAPTEQARVMGNKKPIVLSNYRLKVAFVERLPLLEYENDSGEHKG